MSLENAHSELGIQGCVLCLEIGFLSFIYLRKHWKSMEKWKKSPPPEREKDLGSIKQHLLATKQHSISREHACGGDVSHKTKTSFQDFLKNNPLKWLTLSIRIPLQYSFTVQVFHFFHKIFLTTYLVGFVSFQFKIEIWWHIYGAWGYMKSLR